MAQADYSPLFRALGTDTQQKDYQAYNANIDFDNRIARAAMPINRMVTEKGTVNKDAIENMKPFDDPMNMWESLSANMPSNRGIDPVAFQEKYNAGKQMFDMNLANQVNLLRQGGLSDNQIGKQFDNNLEMKQYMIENGLLQPTAKNTTVKDFATGLASGLGSYGLVRGAQMAAAVPELPTNPDNLARLRDLGYDVKDGRVIKKRATKGMKKADIKAMREARKALNPAQKRLFQEATKKGASKFASNLALRSVSRGFLARAVGGLGGLALGPAGAVAGSVALPMLVQALMGNDEDSKPKSIWE